MMYNLIKQCNSGGKMTPFAAKLISNKLCFYHEIFFATRMRVSQKNEKLVTLSVLSVLIGRSTLCYIATGDVSTSWLAHCALTRLCWQQSVCEPHCQSAQARAETDQFSPLQLSLQHFSSQFKVDLKERATTNKIKHELQWICFPTSLMLQLT